MAKSGRKPLFRHQVSWLSLIWFRVSVYVDADDEEEKGQTMGAMEKGSALSLGKLEPSQHLAQPPAQLHEASSEGAGGAELDVLST